MKFLFWNIRGLGRAARRKQLKDFIYFENLDVVGVQETIKNNFLIEILRIWLGICLLFGTGFLL